MIRNLKVLLAATMALMAFGALSSSSVQAAEFHCSVEPCRVTVKPDGTGKTAHQVITVKQGGSNFSTTCDSIVGEGTASTKTFKALTIGSIKGSNCGFSGVPANLTMNGCEYLIASGGLGGGTLTIVCPLGKEIEAGLVSGGCMYKIPSQGPLNEVKFHDAETGGVKKSELTVELAVKNIAVTVEECWGMEDGPATAEFTTGNTILTSETAGGVKANLWWE